MKLKYVGELDHLVCFVGTSYVLFEKGEFVEMTDGEGAKLLAAHSGKFEKEETKSKSASKTKVVAEVTGDEPSK